MSVRSGEERWGKQIKQPFRRLLYEAATLCESVRGTCEADVEVRESYCTCGT